jgi:LysR family transcriptional regulator, low CO2-responsive transcriptional regulator
VLSIYKLEIFNTVAMLGSFSQAAERLMLTQPAVSQHIRDLEVSLETQLFQRGFRGVTLTPAGEVLLDYTRCILRMVAEAESAVANLDRLAQGQVMIGATPGAGVYWVPGWVQGFQKLYPNLATAVKTATTTQIANDLLAERLDVGFVEGELVVEPPLEMLVLQEIELFVVVGAGHAWWGKNEISLQALHGMPFIARLSGSHTRSWVDKLLQQYGVAARIIAEFDNPEAIKQAVASGMGVTVLPEWAVAPEELSGRLQALPIKDFQLKRTLKVVWNDAVNMKPVVKAFLSHLAGQFPQLARLVTIADPAESDLPAREGYLASRMCSNRASTEGSASKTEQG